MRCISSTRFALANAATCAAVLLLLMSVVPVASGNPGYAIKTFQQVRDHAGNPTDTFSQRYLIDNRSFRAEQGVVFLVVGGETALLELSDTFVAELAVVYRALLVSLEHRFYGEAGDSQPSDMSTSNLKKLLTVSQAIEDLATFLRFVIADLRIARARVVAFGGSYAGVLAAWLRVRHPDLVVGAIASSAPVVLQLDAPHFYSVVTNTFGLKSAGGSERCVRKINETMRAFDALLSSPQGRAQLVRQLHLCPDFHTDADAYALGLSVNHAFGNAAMSHESKLRSWICQVVTRGTPGIDTLVKLRQAKKGAPCARSSYSTLLDDAQKSGHTRAWTWQTCSELGLITSCSGRVPQCVLSSFESTAAQLQFCNDAYHPSPPLTAASLNATFAALMSKYVGNLRHPNGSNILFINHKLDPWYHYSILHSSSNDLTTGVKAIDVEGTNHGLDVFIQRGPHAPRAARAAQTQISAAVARILQTTAPAHVLQAGAESALDAEARGARDGADVIGHVAAAVTMAILLAGVVVMVAVGVVWQQLDKRGQRPQQLTTGA